MRVDIPMIVLRDAEWLRAAGDLRFVEDGCTESNWPFDLAAVRRQVAADAIQYEW
jgi:hypothetical protein